jgi:hypothetical protein
MSSIKFAKISGFDPFNKFPLNQRIWSAIKPHKNPRIWLVKLQYARSRYCKLGIIWAHSGIGPSMKLLEFRSSILSFVKLTNHEGIVASVKFVMPRCISVRFVRFPRLECKTPMKFVVLKFKMLLIPQNYQGLILQYLSMKGLVFEVL